jgi:hypothetical protein
MARRTPKHIPDPVMEWDADREAEAARIALSWRQRFAEDEVEIGRWLDSLPKMTDEEVPDFEGRYLDSWEQQAYVYGKR